MLVTVKTRAKAGGNKGKLATDERQGLLEKKQELEQLTKDISYEGNISDKGEIQEKLNRVNTQLAKDDEIIAKGKDKDWLVKRSRTLEGYIKTHVPSLSLQRAKKGTPEYAQALELGRKALDPAVVEACNEYRDIERRLDPENPDAGSIENLVS